MTRDELLEIYRGYIDCLNRQDWPHLGRFVHESAEYNGTTIGLAGYRAMLERDFEAIPDLRFVIELLASDPPRIASRLQFDCTPRGMLFGLPVNGRRVQFAENVFYEFSGRQIRTVWSIIDQAAIARQIEASSIG
ncbi:Predicted ester cyclase [Kaistia soli DSM 19436]|uniref:Predicted ester cyclase n=1 Tax=Kaistia soli DSM 19436 TaxID=1122133 RepID=A0A1M4UBA5_9HYPH|nr:ester cyclase [Kaistia soli]SHE53964.1 Predicted ester cyclase [Kaistia soli DSM 19436]